MMKEIFAFLGGLFLAFMIGIIVCLFSGCTYSINMVDTHGEAADVVDETETVDPEFNPTLSLPGAL